MLDFTHVLHVEGLGFLHLTFNCITSPQKKKLHVTVLTRGPQCHHFSMEERSDQWKIITAPQPPEWIMKLEKALEGLIQRQARPFVVQVIGAMSIGKAAGY